MRLENGQWAAFHNLGFYDASAQAQWDLIDRFRPELGMKFVLSNGDSCSGGPDRVSNIYFDCTPGAPNPLNVNMTVADVGCAYDFHIATPSACPTSPAPPGPTPTPPTPAPGGSGRLSGGSIFLIIFFVFGFVYFAGGCIFRRVSYGVGGMEACPNHEFWQSLPGLVSDGAKYVFNTITCRGGTYDTVH